LEKYKRFLIPALKFVGVAALFYFMQKRGLISEGALVAVVHTPWVFASIILLLMINTMLGTWRWKILLHAQGITLGWLKVLHLNLIGCFFNIALPGAVSGDVVKAVLVVRVAEGKRSNAFGSILIDRIMGMSALVTVACFATFLNAVDQHGFQFPMPLLVSILLSGLGVLGFFGYVLVASKRDPLGKLLNFFATKYPKTGSLARVYQSILSYRSHKRALAATAGISLFIHLILISIAFLVADVLAPTPPSIALLSIIVPVGMLFTAIPILPAGIGTGHAAFYFLFNMVGLAIGVDVFNWIVLTQVAVGVLGGVIYVLHPVKVGTGIEMSPNDAAKSGPSDPKTPSTRHS
jgi:glycosyltransferase 2 family protein